MSVIFSGNTIRFTVNDPNEHTGYEGKFYHRSDAEHRTLCQLSSRHELGIYSYSAKTALTTIFRVFQGKNVGQESPYFSLENTHIRFLFRNSYFNKIIRLKRMSSLRGVRRKFSTLFLKT